MFAAEKEQTNYFEKDLLHGRYLELSIHDPIIGSSLSQYAKCLCSGRGANIHESNEHEKSIKAKSLS